MRIAILSDIHSNIEALSKALSIISESRIDKIVCLGDTVGYGTNPNECLTLIRQNAQHVVLGNHDQASVDVERTEGFNDYAKITALWTNRHLNPEHFEYIGDLPVWLELDDLYFTHASPHEPLSWHYVMSESDALRNFHFFRQKICFIGHTHFPKTFCEDGASQEIGPDKRYIINVGSVGQPRDHDNRLSFGIFDTDHWTYQNIRAEYDWKSASQKISEAGLPPFLAERIRVGR